MSRRHAPRRGRDRLVTALWCLVLVALLVGLFVYRTRVLEPKRAELLGRVEPPGLRLMLASQYAFSASYGAAYRVVPGRPALDVEDLPTYALTTALGGFRGIYAIRLWTEAEEAKHQHEHLDLLDTYYRLAALQGDYPTVWSFHAWNLAWNIPVQWQDLERRYQWIRRAIEYAKEGYRRNPRSADLMVTVADIYMDKLGHPAEPDYYRERVLEDEGRSVYLVAYEWYNRAREADMLWGTMRDRPRTVTYRKACMARTLIARQRTIEARQALEQAIAAHYRDADDVLVRESVDAARRLTAEAVDLWDVAAAEWRTHYDRWKDKVSLPDLLEVARRFFFEARLMTVKFAGFRDRISVDALPELRAAGVTADAFAALDRAVEYRGEENLRRGKVAFAQAQAALTRAVAAWQQAAERAPPETPAAYADYADHLQKLSEEMRFDDVPRYVASRRLALAREALTRYVAPPEGTTPSQREMAFRDAQRRLMESREAWIVAKQEAQAILAGETPSPRELTAEDRQRFESYVDEANRYGNAVTEAMSELTLQTADEVLADLPEPPLPWREVPLDWPARDVRL